MILKRLKQSTQIYHDALEQNLNVLDQLLTREQYQSLLERFYGFYAPLERGVEKSFNLDLLPFDFLNRRKTFLLKRDLTFLGASQTQIENLPLCQNLPAINKASQIFGCFYVLEGSTLGGQIISKHLNGRLGLDEQNGAAFFNGYGAQTGLMWKSFGAALTAFASDSQTESEIIASAGDAFRKIDFWLNKGTS